MYIHKTGPIDYCPSEYGMNLFGGKWKPRIVCLLSIKGVLRNKEIKEFTPGISDQALAGTMRDLVAAQLVERIQYNEVPIRVEYTLTEKGKSLVPILHSICKWTVETYGTQVAGTEYTCPFRAQQKGKL